MSDAFVRVVLPRPIDRALTYAVNPELLQSSSNPLGRGSIVEVPLGKKKIHAFVVEGPISATALTADDPPPEKIKQIERVIHEGASSRVGEDLLKLCDWVHRFYGSSLGEVLGVAAPPAALGLRSSKRNARDWKKYEQPAERKTLTEAQAQIVEEIVREASLPEEALPHLIHGVTGSGKTEVYIEIAHHVLSSQKSVLILVPEIALTTQHFQRIQKGLGERVGVWHSAMPAGQRRDLMEALISGQCRVVVGARSAVFAPLQNLGLIVVDEEHDPTYKQEDRVRYHARDVAIVRAKQAGAQILLGTATPSFESLERVRQGKYRLHRLDARATSGGMPELKLVDLTQVPRVEEIRAPFAELTLKAVEETLAAGNQAMVFLNRRGFSASLVCEDCGYVQECSQCSMSLTYHRARRALICHVCGENQRAPEVCPTCQGSHWSPLGVGTESLSDDLEKALPQAKILRLDRDQVTSQSRLEETLGLFQQGKANLLIGTQMLVKGHDFPGVTLVVVVLADALFRWPDFRAQERALQVLKQVSGRAGRGAQAGRVLIQTYDPEHPVLQTLLNPPLEEEWYLQERELRQALHYPPFWRLCRFRLEASQSKDSQDRAQRLTGQLQHWVQANHAESRVEILGPSEAFLEKAKGIFRWDILVKAASIQDLQTLVRSFKRECQNNRWDHQVDVDPYSVS